MVAVAGSGESGYKLTLSFSRRHAYNHCPICDGLLGREEAKDDSDVLTLVIQRMVIPFINKSGNIKKENG